MICKIKWNLTNHWSYISKFQLNDVLLGKTLSLSILSLHLKKNTDTVESRRAACT